MTKLTFHLLGNAHLDPVWLWDWREGLNEGLITCRTILDLMDEDPELTFNRGEAVIYEHIEKTDPSVFKRIQRYVKTGRWDVIGGTFLQSDENLPDTETLVRQFVRGQQYFKSRFDRIVEVGWAADCFGHAAGMPEIMASAGIKYFAFTRPAKNAFPISRPAFWWVGPGGSRILSYRPIGFWYGTERPEINERLDQALADSQDCGLRNVGVFYGLGNHGGGPTRRQIADIREWQKHHPETEVVHSTMHRFFHTLEKEVNAKTPNFLPKVAGELNFNARGCYSSLARLKFPYRKTQAHLLRAERTSSVIAAKLGKAPFDLSSPWDSVLFNSFHDILPGTSIERACDEQIGDLGGAVYKAQAVEFQALNALSNQIDTRVLKSGQPDMPAGVSVFVWNPHPRQFKGYVEMETCLDWRPISKYKNRMDEFPVRILDDRKKPVPFQLVEVDNSAFCDTVWRKRAVVPVQLLPMGWSAMEMAWVEGATAPSVPDSQPATAPSPDSITNSIFKIRARVGDKGIKILRNGKAFLGGDGFSAAVFEDHYGSWGGGPSPDCSTMTEAWKITEVHLLEKGPWRSALWVRLAGGKSRIDLTVRLYAGRDAVEVCARVLWVETQSRLKIIMPFGVKQAEFEVPGATVKRPPLGEVPGGRWVRVIGKNGRSFGFISNAIYNFDCKDDALRATIVRSSGYSYSGKIKDGEPWKPPSDCGELKFNFLLVPGNQDLPELAQQLEQPPVILPVPAKPGPLPRRGSLLELKPSGLRTLAFKPAQDGKGWILRIQEISGKTVRPELKILGKTLRLDKIGAGRIASWRILVGKKNIRARLCDAVELYQK